jgi:hypothetical protein
VPAPPNLAPSVGGILELHYAEPGAGSIYPIRLAVTTFALTPSGPNNDYLYTGAGGFTPGEAGVIATFQHLAAVWAPYYADTWLCYLAAVHQNVGGAPYPLPVVPTVGAVTGSAVPPSGPPARSKRIVWLFSQLNARWRLYLRQLPSGGEGEFVPCDAYTGGLDARDRAWFAYVSGPESAVVGRDGKPMQPAGDVRAWWDTPLADAVVGIFVVSG